LQNLGSTPDAVARGGGGATRPLPRNGSVEELLGDPTVGSRPKGVAVSLEKTLKGALNPNLLNFTKNREKFCL